jgi:predicted helicase
MTLDQYLSNISTEYKNAISTELYDGTIPNLTEDIINQIAHKIELHFILAKDPEGNVCMANNKDLRSEFRQTFDPIDILDYAYAILNSSNFRLTSKKILKMNFPYPKNAETFWELAEIGSQIKQIHSLKILKTEDSITYQQKITLALSETNRLIKKIDKIKLE